MRLLDRVSRAFVNLTSHEINILDYVDIPPSGSMARVSTRDHYVGDAAGVPLYAQRMGRVTGLPDPDDGITYIVSHVVRLALPGRLDLASPGYPVRDDHGRIIGCKGLVINTSEDRDDR